MPSSDMHCKISPLFKMGKIKAWVGALLEFVVKSMVDVETRRMKCEGDCDCLKRMKMRWLVKRYSKTTEM
jgi:hypothetical protein